MQNHYRWFGVSILVVVLLSSSLLLVRGTNDEAKKANESYHESIESGEVSVSEVHTLEETHVLNASEIPSSDIVSEFSDDTFAVVLERYDEKVTPRTKEVFEDMAQNEKRAVLVRYKQDFDTEKLDDFSDAMVLDTVRVGLVEVGVDGLSVLLADEGIALVEVDQEVQFLGEVVPWHVEQTLADIVWNQTIGSGIKVAVLDSGVAAHDDFDIAGGWNVVEDTADYDDTYGHGTMVAGVLAATLNDDGLVGVSPATTA